MPDLKSEFKERERAGSASTRELKEKMESWDMGREGRPQRSQTMMEGGTRVRGGELGVQGAGEGTWQAWFQAR